MESMQSIVWNPFQDGMESSRRKCTFGDAMRLRRYHTRLRVIPYQACGLNKKFDKSKLVEFFWQGRKDSNPGHPVLETGVLPTELYPFIAVNYYNTYCRVLQVFFEKNLLYFYFLAFSPIFKAFITLCRTNGTPRMSSPTKFVQTFMYRL